VGLSFGQIVIGWHAEDVVHHEDQGAVFILGEFSFRIAEGLERGAGFGAGLTVFLEEKRFPARAGEGVEEPGESGRIAAEFLIEGAGAEIAEGLKDVKGAELESGMIDLGGIEIAYKVFAGFLAGAGAGDEGLLDKPILMATFLPLRKVAGIEVRAAGPETRYDLGVRDAIGDPLVDLVADGFGKASDFAIGAATAGRLSLSGGSGWIGASGDFAGASIRVGWGAWLHK
jgi:hypothetical protein